MSDTERKEIKTIVDDLKKMDNRELAIVETFSQGVKVGVRIAQEKEQDKHE